MVWNFATFLHIFYAFLHIFYIFLGEIVHGGKNDPTMFFIEPTIVKNVTEKDSLMQEEIFGPILSLVNCDTFQEAIHFINQRDTPLAAYCFAKGTFLYVFFHIFVFGSYIPSP